jgi:hypothetical protein
MKLKKKSSRNKEGMKKDENITTENFSFCNRKLFSNKMKKKHIFANMRSCHPHNHPSSRHAFIIRRNVMVLDWNQAEHGGTGGSSPQLLGSNPQFITRISSYS